MSSEEFQVYTKRPKISHTTGKSGEEETQSTTVVEGEYSSLFSSSQQITSTPSSKKWTDTSLINQPTQGAAKLSIF
jgi:hypothetical protein